MKSRVEKGVILISDDVYEPDYPLIARRNKIRFVFAILAVLFLIGGALAGFNH